MGINTGEWSAEEDNIMLSLIPRFKGHWHMYVPFFSGRTQRNIQNRYDHLWRENRRTGSSAIPELRSQPADAFSPEMSYNIEPAESLFDLNMPPDDSQNGFAPGSFGEEIWFSRDVSDNNPFSTQFSDFTFDRSFGRN
jgi:hypothetical protein